MQNSIAVEAHVVSSRGKHRENHEDNFLFHMHDFINEALQKEMTPYGQNSVEIHLAKQAINRSLFVIADGMGGHQSGEVASRLATMLIKESMEPIINSVSIEGASEKYQQLVQLLNKHFLQIMKTDKKYAGMGTTLTSLLLFEGQCIALHIGDSRIYVYDPQKGLQKITTDHVASLIVASNQEKFTTRKVLTRYIGMGTADLKLRASQSAVIDITSKKRLLLCSDGLTDIVDDATIAHVLQTTNDVTEATHKLVQLANEGTRQVEGGTDNITVLILDCWPFA